MPALPSLHTLFKKPKRGGCLLKENCSILHSVLQHHTVNLTQCEGWPDEPFYKRITQNAKSFYHSFLYPTNPFGLASNLPAATLRMWTEKKVTLFLRVAKLSQVIICPAQTWQRDDERADRPSEWTKPDLALNQPSPWASSGPGGIWNLPL